MAGLGTPMAPQAAPEQEEAGEYGAGGMGSASPQEQEALQQFAEAAFAIIYPEDAKGQVAPRILDDLKGNIDPEAAQMFEGVEPPLTNSPQDAVSATAVLVSLMADQKIGLLQQAMQQGGAAQQQPPHPEPAGQMEPAGHSETRESMAQERAEPMQRPGMPMQQGGEEEAEPEEESEFSPEAVLMEGGKTIVEELVTISEAANLHDFKQEEVDGVFYRSVDLFRVVMTKLNPQMVEQLGQQFGEVIKANNEGRLNKILPGLPGGAGMQRGA